MIQNLSFLKNMWKLHRYAMKIFKTLWKSLYYVNSIVIVSIARRGKRPN